MAELESLAAGDCGPDQPVQRPRCPVDAAARHARKAVADDGTVVFVEPAAADRLDDNLHPIGLTYYAASTALCVPQALSQTHEHDVLGAQAGPRRLAELLAEAGFSRRARPPGPTCTW